MKSDQLLHRREGASLDVQAQGGNGETSCTVIYRSRKTRARDISTDPVLREHLVTPTGI